MLIGIIALSFTLSSTMEIGKLPAENENSSEDNGKLPGESGKISGVISWNDAYGSPKQPDAGCQIYILNEANTRSTQYAGLENVIENFQRNKSQYSQSVYNTIDPGRIKKARDNFDTLSKHVSNYISGFKKLPAVARVAPDAAGNFTFCLKPGRYFILFVSGSVTSNNIAESKGNIALKIVDVRLSGETFLDVTFEKKERIMNFALVPQGC